MSIIRWAPVPSIVQVPVGFTVQYFHYVLLLNKNQKPRSSGCGKQCDQIGRFLTVLAHKFSIKSCPNSSRLFGPVWKIIVKETKKLWTLLGKFRKIWATLILKYGHTELARDSKSRGHELKSCKRWTVVVLNWSVWSPSAPTIRVWIPLKSTVAFFQIFFTPASFLFIFSPFIQTSQFLQQINVKNVHPAYGTELWTHNLLIISLLH